MIKRIHINQHMIRRNQSGEDLPVITVKAKGKTTYYKSLKIEGPSKLIYSPDKPLSCGARVWIETHAELIGEPLAAPV